MKELIVGFAAGVFLFFAGSNAYVRGLRAAALRRPCRACGRPSRLSTSTVDLETGELLAATILCEPCASFIKNVLEKTPAPWAHTWE